MSAFIKAISYYLPESILTNEDLINEFPEWTVEKVAGKVGVNQRHIAAESETAADMATCAAEKLFKEHDIDRSTIDFVLLCTQSPDYFLPTSACIIQHNLGLSTSCGALDYNLGCSGFVYGLSLAKGLIAADVAKNVLLLTAETYSKHIHPKDKGNKTIFGDASAATLISTDGFAKIGNFSLGTDGRGVENLIVKKGGMRQPKSFDDIVFDDLGNPTSSDFLYMNGSEIFNFTSEAVPVMINNVLEKNHLLKDDVQLFVFHQANKYMMNYLRKLIEIDVEKFFFFLRDVGNTVSSTIPIALYEALKEKKANGNILLAGFGVGYSWGGCILEIAE
jgi:3-oxoacyl-[acyl-carrier-protein] synthase III